MNDPNFSDKDQKAFDFASDVVKQQITLSSGILAVMIAAAGLFSDTLGSIGLYILAGSWILFLVSIILGCYSLMSLTYQLTLTTPSIGDSGVRSKAILQSIFFVLGIILTISFGISTAFSQERERENMYKSSEQILNDLPKELKDNTFIVEFTEVISRWNNETLRFPPRMKLRPTFERRLHYATSRKYNDYETREWYEERLLKFDGLPKYLKPQIKFTKLATKTMIWAYSINLPYIKSAFKSQEVFKKDPLPFFLVFAEAQLMAKRSESKYISSSQVISAAFAWWTNAWPFCSGGPELIP